MKVLVLNSGSSSIKYRIFEMDGPKVLASGILEKIGQRVSRLNHTGQKTPGEAEDIVRERPISGHREGLEWIIAVASASGALSDGRDLFGVGHRVVHGGDAFSASALIDKGVVEAIRGTVPLAPLHNPANLMGIEVALELFPGVPQVAVFDTAFHHSLPPRAFRYALPDSLYADYQVRRYGFHGTSHQYVAGRAAAFLGRPLWELDLVTLHLGNGASAAAISAGRSIDTSMGMTPLEGLAMGTRCGDIDPAVHFYLARAAGKSLEEIESILYRESGLKGICGLSDMRDVERLAREGDGRAGLAIDVFCYRTKKYIGAYFAALGRVDALVFTGGIGENSALIRSRSCEGLAGLGIVLDEGKNEAVSGKACEIQGELGSVKVLVVATDEEGEIARQTVEVIRAERR